MQTNVCFLTIPATWLALSSTGCTGRIVGGDEASDSSDAGETGPDDLDAQGTSFAVPRIVHRTLANDNWGYPYAGDSRRVAPTILMVVHIFGVEDTAAMPIGIDPGTGTYQEYTAISKPSYTRNSAHDYIARNGEVIEVIDPAPYAAWSNGALNDPDRSIPTIDAIASQATYNPNELCYREVENTGYPVTFELTGEQKETVAYFVAIDSIATGLDIDRTTVTTHADFDSVNRARCAFPPADREAALAGIIDRARVMRAEMLAAE